MVAHAVARWTGIALAVLVLAACGKKAGPPPPTRIGFVATTDGFGDRGYNDAAHAALVACNAQTHANVETTVPDSADDVERDIVLYATEKFNTVIGMGYGSASAIGHAARRFDDVHFALIDAIADQPNVQSLTFREADGAFLAGALAALVSKTHRVAFIGGTDVPLLQHSEAGFIAGARQADPRVRVTARYLQSFVDVAPARALADTLLGDGADILFVVAGPAGAGAIASVQAHPGTYLIGSDTDQDALAPGKILTSVVKHIDAAVLRVCLETVAGKTATGERVLGIADDGIGLTDFRYTRAIVGDAALARIERIRAALAAGRIHAPDTRGALAHFAALPGV